MADLAQILTNCERSYFDPETFRINTNQFLQTARTVTFIIQKNKGSIADFDAWYASHVIEPWSMDTVMTWARDSRNTIEKVGDLDLHSNIAITLIFSYFEEEDIAVPCGRSELVANVKRLLRFARRHLPSGVSDVSVLRLDRRWVANTLPDWELLHALTYAYARIREACVGLARHLGSDTFDFAPEATDFDPLSSDARRTRYLRLNDTQLSKIGTVRMRQDPNLMPPPSLMALVEETKREERPHTLEENVAFSAKYAKATFEHFGNHVPMLFFFDKDFAPVDFMSAEFKDQATKYLFWRSVADRVLYLKPASLIWICEAWLRSFGDSPELLPEKIMRNLPITGETLGVHGMDASGKMARVHWNIFRDRDGRNPRLEPVDDQTAFAERPNYFVPALRAFEKLREISSGRESTK